MPITHADLATACAQVTDRLERHGANPFRVRASGNTARAVGELWLDFTDVRCRMIRDEGVSVAIDAYAHSMHDFDNLVHGIGQARRDWL